MNARKVAVTGLGVVAPHGVDPDTVFDALCAGRSAIHSWRGPSLEVPVVVATSPFDPSPWLTRLQLVGLDRASQFAVAAGASAHADAAFEKPSPPERIGVYVGTGFGGAGSVETGYERIATGERVLPLTVVASMPNAPAAHLAMRMGAMGPVLTYSIACASSSIAIAEAAKAIACGEVDVALAGGTEAMLVPGVVRAWQAMRTLAPPDANDASSSCRPFSISRKGMVLGEGAAFMVLEALKPAKARGARIYAEVAGSGVSCDSSHLTKPSAAGQTAALRQALERSGLRPEDIGYCNAHGTATHVGDAVECESLRAVWRGDFRNLQVSSTKSMHGHLLGAAGALEALITVLALHHGVVPPNAHCSDQDPACDIPLARRLGATASNLVAAISNSFAFGGTNCVLAFRQVH